MAKPPPKQRQQTETLPAAAETPALAGSRNWRLGGLLVLAAASLLAGWVLPVMTIKTFYIFDDQLSILGACFRLLEEGEVMLFLIILVFTVIFPATKLALAFDAWARLQRADARLHRTIHWIETLGKWSMLDVFVVALVVVVVKLSYVSDVTVHLGLYVFALAVILSMVAVKGLALQARAEARNLDINYNVKNNL